MPEFLALLETIRAEDASVQRLFGGEGRPAGRSRRDEDPRYMSRLAETARFMADVTQGRRPAYQLREALTTSDFPNLFGDIIDRQLLANYRETPATWTNYAKRGTVPDFRTVKRFEVNNAEAVLAQVDQGGAYPESKLTDNAYEYSVQKYGRTIPFAWEAMVDDDLQALQDIPARFGKAARRSEEKFATQLFVDANGPHASLYTTANKNQVVTANGSLDANPALSIRGLQDAMTVLLSQKDSDGEPITIDAVELVVPPALEVTAQNILNATELWLNEAGGSTNQQVHTVNWMRQRVHLNVNYYIPIVASSANGNTSWFLFANPNGQRPAIEVGFLRGHGEPEVFMKQPNMVHVGGGAGTFQDGDFETDTLSYKVRHVFGGTQENPKMTVASNGSGS